MSESQPDPFGESAKTDLKAYKEAAEKYSRMIIEAIETNDRHALEAIIEDGGPEEEEGRHFYNVRNMCARREKYELTVAMYEEALKTYKRPSVLNNLASSFKTLSQYGKALECYSRALKMDPNYIVGYARTAILIEAYALSSPTPAIEYINNYLSKGDF